MQQVPKALKDLEKAYEPVTTSLGVEAIRSAAGLDMEVNEMLEAY